MNVQSIRKTFIDKLAAQDFAEDGNLEIINASFIADEPLIFGELNDVWNARELRWYMSQSLNVNDIAPPVPLVWQQVASKKGMINSNYGWCVFSNRNGHQFHKAIDALIKNKNSRQAVMIYIRPSMHEDSVIDGMRDFMCTYSTQLLIRGGKLHHIVNMRSNDVVYGYKGDMFWQDTVLDLALARLNANYPELVKGNLYWNAGSLHVYPKHFHLVQS
jgi:thymidylate synthase